VNQTGAEDSLVGRTLDGRYTIEAILGVGGMGAVYRARHVHLGTTVAIKVMRSSQPDATRRFLAEARRTFRLDHPNCVRASDAGVTEDGALLYLVMELLEGRTLGEELERDGPLAAARAAHIGAQVADAIDCAHRLGYVHRDIKPDNIMLLHRGDDPDFVKVLDFGLAKLYDEARLVNTRSVLSFTQDGIVFGTPHYMSPEQAQGHRLDPRSDLYSLGIVLYEALAGEVPFDSDAQVEILIAQVKKRPRRLASRRRGLPPVLEALVHELLAKDPAARPANAGVVAAALRTVSETREPSRVPVPLAASETLQLASGPMAAAEAPTKRMGPLGRETLAAIQPRRWPLVAGGLALLFAAGALLAWGLSRVADRGPGLAPLEAAVPPAADAAPELGAAAAPEPDAGAPPVTDAGPAAPEPPASPPSPRLSPAKKQARELVARARAARSNLQRLGLADKAHRLDPANREARHLFAEALIATGDAANRAKGCRLLARSPARHRRAGCAD
jgi:serine/threonine-protein kinase